MWSSPPAGFAPACDGPGRSWGPEPFSSAFNGPYLQQKLKRLRPPIQGRPARPRRWLAGVGNILRDESLFTQAWPPSAAFGQASAPQSSSGLCNPLIEVLEISIGCQVGHLQRLRDLQRHQWPKYGRRRLGLSPQRQPCRAAANRFQRLRLAGRSSTGAPLPALTRCSENR